MNWLDVHPARIDPERLPRLLAGRSNAIGSGPDIAGFDPRFKSGPRIGTVARAELVPSAPCVVHSDLPFHRKSRVFRATPAYREDFAIAPPATLICLHSR